MENILRILLVDHDEVDRKAVQQSLKAADVQAEMCEATNYATAINLLKQSTFDCVFLEYCLPDKNGLALVQELRQEGIRTPLIILTGQGEEEIAVELMKAGASDYLAKSRISPETLSRIMRHAVRVYQAEMRVALANQQLIATNELLLRQNQKLEKQRQQIQLQNLELLEAYRSKSRFLATMSHELRTPMNAIIGFSQMLLRYGKGALNSQQKDMAERILNNARHLLSLINEILDFSKIETGQLELQPDEFDLPETINDTVEELRVLANQKHLFLEVQFNLQSSRVVNDQRRLRQVLANLISNAIKFTEVGGVRVEISEFSSNRISIVVSDTGIGMTPADLDHIFAPFQQVDQSTTRKYGGTGLGLAITHSLVQMMHGKITVKSKLDKGSEFRVEIPRQVQDLTAIKPNRAVSQSNSDSFQAS